MRYAYPYELTSQPEGGFTVTFPDVPEAITQGDNEKEAAAMAEDALVTALSFYTDQAEGLPHPSPAHGRHRSYVPPLVRPRLALHDAMLTAGVSNVLWRGSSAPMKRRCAGFGIRLHQSRINQVDTALRVLGKRMGIVIEAA